MLALVVDYRRPGEKSGVAIIWRVLQVAVILLVVVSFLKTAQHFEDPMPGLAIHPVQLDPNAKFIFFAQAMNEGQEAFGSMLHDHDVTAAAGAIKKLQSAPSLDPIADELKDRLVTLLTRAQSLYSKEKSSPNPNDKDLKEQETLLKSDLSSWSKDYNVWLKTLGRSYGLVEVTEPEPQPQRQQK
jgi:hypothetical protein